MKNKKVEVNVGPQINCADAVESIEINDSTNLICNCSKVTKMITKSKYENCFLPIQKHLPLCFALGVGFGTFLDFLIGKCSCCCCGNAAAGGLLTLKSFLIGLLLISVTTGVGKMLERLLSSEIQKILILTC